jgi:flagellar export protein FliJ
MAFQFSLATVLRVREIAEEKEERLLTQILGQIAKTRQDLNDLKAQVDMLLRRSASELTSSISAAQLHITYGQMRALELMQKDVAEQLAKLETLRDQQMKNFAAARRKREVLSQLREDQLERFQYERSRQEQALMDDNFAARWNR